jgi:glycerophosphoryl diester phosphodiesterase
MRRALVLVALLLPAVSANGVPMNVGHRGYSAATPENTLTAERRAFEVGADMVELDVQKSADGHVVVIHDDTVGRTTDSLTDARVDSLTLCELRSLDAGYPDRFGSEFAGERIPTLEEILEEAKGRGPLLLDQKSALLFGSEIAAALADTAFPLDQVWVTAWNEAQVADIQLHVPSARILWTQGAPSIWEATMGDFLDRMEGLGVEGISVVFENYTYSAPGLAAATQERGLLAFAWSFEQAPETLEKMRTAIAIGLDGFIVNDPETFAAILAEPTPTPTVTPSPTVTPQPTPTPAPPGPLDRGQRTCVNAMNKNGEKVNAAQLKDNEKCLKDHQKGRLTTSFEACITADRKDRIRRAQEKTAMQERDRCLPGGGRLPLFPPISTPRPASKPHPPLLVDLPPPFAYTASATVNQAAVDGALALARGIFGDPIEDADLLTIATDPEVAKCQREMLERANKVENAVLEEINKAKKKALKEPAVDSAASLETALAAPLLANDRITKAENRLLKKIDRKCASLRASPAAIFPGRCADPDLGVVEKCVIAAARCQACMAVNVFDGLALECDRADDQKPNLSCP